MEQGKLIGYAEIVPSGELELMLNDKTYELDLQKDFQTRGLKKSMNSLGISNSPEDQIRKNAQKALGKFALLEIGTQQEVSNIVEDYVPLSEVYDLIEQLPNNRNYYLFPTEAVPANNPFVIGTIDLFDSENIAALLIGFNQPYAKVVEGRGLLETETKLYYDSSIFPSKCTYQVGDRIGKGKFVKL